MDKHQGGQDAAADGHDRQHRQKQRKRDPEHYRTDHFHVAAAHRSDREQSGEEKENQKGRAELDRDLGPEREAGSDPEGDREQRHRGVEPVGNRSRPDIADRRGNHQQAE